MKFVTVLLLLCFGVLGLRHVVSSLRNWGWNPYPCKAKCQPLGHHGILGIYLLNVLPLSLSLSSFLRICILLNLTKMNTNGFYNKGRKPMQI